MAEQTCCQTGLLIQSVTCRRENCLQLPSAAARPGIDVPLLLQVCHHQECFPAGKAPLLQPAALREGGKVKSHSERLPPLTTLLYADQSLQGRPRIKAIKPLRGILVFFLVHFHLGSG